MKFEPGSFIGDRHFRELFGGSFTVFLSKLLGMALSYVFILLISHSYGADATGAYTLATTVAILISIVGRLGLDTALLRFVAEYSFQHKWSLVKDIYRKSLRFVVPFSFLLSLLLYVSSAAIAERFFQNSSLTRHFRIISFAVLPIALMLTNAEVLRAQKRNAVFSFFQTTALPLLSILFLICLQNMADQSLIPTASYVLAAAMGAVLTFMIRKTGHGFAADTDPEPSRAGDLLHVSLPMMVSNVLLFIMMWIDTIMIGVLRSESEVGVYSVALRVAALSNISLFAIAGVVAPKIVEYHSANDRDNFEKTARLSATVNFWTSFPIFVAIAAAPAFFMRLFGRDFEHGSSVLLVLAAAQLINTVSGPAGLILQMTGKERMFRNLIIVTIALNFALDIVLIPSYGIMGAAFANLISLLFWNIGTVVSVRSIHRIWTFYVPLLRRYISWNWSWNLDSALRYEQAVSLIKRIKPQTVVEVGSGNWGISSYADCPSYAVDIHFDNQVKPGLQKRIIASGAQLPFSNASADFVVSADMLEHVPADQRPRVIKEMFRIVKPDGHVYIAVPVGERSAQADLRINEAFLSRKGVPHPMLRDHVAYGLPSRRELVQLVRAEARSLGWPVTVLENTPLSLWEKNLQWFGVERWIPGLRHFQRIILQPLYPLLSRVKSVNNYRIILIAGKSGSLYGDSTILPSFFVVGAQRSGTTSLHDWLSRQPDVSLPRIKETHFFSDDARYARGTDWYLTQFHHRQKDHTLGEVDPDYLFYEEAPFRISASIEKPRFVFIFRHPIERAYSHYLMSVNRGYETLSFADALKAEQNRFERSNSHYRAYYSYMARGRYHEQVMRYRDIFPDSPHLYVKFDDLFNPAKCFEAYSSICSFLGVRSAPIEPDLSAKLNIASGPRSVLLRNYLYGDHPLKKALALCIPSFDLRLKLALFLDKLNQKPLQRSPQEWRKTVPREFWHASNEEIRKLQNLTGLDLLTWYYRDEQSSAVFRPVS